MVMMLGRIELLTAVATDTELIALGFKFNAVGLVAVHTADAGMIHLALHKRPVDKYLIENLPIAVIGWWC